MGGDRRAKAGNVIVTTALIKSSSWTPLRCGDRRSAGNGLRIWRAFCKTSFEYYRRSQLQLLSPAAKVRALARLLRENLPLTMQGVGVVMPLFAGVDQSASPPAPQIHFYDPLGSAVSRGRLRGVRFGFRHNSQYFEFSGNVTVSHGRRR